MNNVVATALVLALVSSCGGHSERRSGADGGASSATTGGVAMTTDGGATAAAGTGGQGGSTRSSYIPDHPEQPVQGDGRVSGGSFEDVLGVGWDFCFTRYPGCSLAMGDPAPSDGEVYLTFDSSRDCAASFACSSTGGDLQVGFWLGSVIPAGEAVHLYFDIINLAAAQPTGELVLDATEGTCVNSELLVTVPLADLDLEASWQTRCVSFIPSASFPTFGVHVTGESFNVGLDVLRFGPPCHDP